MSDTPEIPEAMLDQILADPEAIEALQAIAAQAGVSTPVPEMSREEQTRLVVLMMAIAKQAAQQDEDGAADGRDVADVPDEVIAQIFADPRAQDILRDIMEANELAGEPANLPVEAKRAIVKLLVDQGIVSFG